MSERTKKRFFSKHAKSSAALISLGIHAVLLVVAISFVAVTVIHKEDQVFEAKQVRRPKVPIKKLQVPVNIKKKKTQKPKLRKRIVVKQTPKVPEIKMPEITGVKGGMGGGYGDGGGNGLGFNMPEIDFFGAKGKGEKVVFIVHFGPATIGKNPYQRMTGYTIRNRLEDLINELPGVSLFNVAAYWANDTIALNPEMMLATPDNKQKVMDWMEPVNPLKGNYDHCFVWQGAQKKVTNARSKYPQRVTGLPSYSTKWAYPYEVPGGINTKYLGQGKKFMHWNRGVTWALQTQKPDTIFILTTNYIDDWGNGAKGNPSKVSGAYRDMIRDIYGPDKNRWPTLNVVVLQHGNSNADVVLNSQFGPIIKAFRGNGSVIRDISKYMTDEERAMYKDFRSQYN
ncbi:hypothetical protein PDESU_04255 [Pontiella desulfatans]|uniref:Uncharacterized protein n=1 Tax=Pontiella desulfatans TaxID=2750659 RepID=A0A6C2U6M7_PONDE|nr:hypothetical protein [Pontiella desulfatans]VGO15670.1 hypothetical protein PDESU_04255 [Pontiella desulfatans]